MAAVDKIYGTRGQYVEFRSWCERRKPEALKHFNVEPPEKGTHAITNFPEHIDKWLIKNCDIDWVVKYIKNQYSISGNPSDNFSEDEQ